VQVVQVGPMEIAHPVKPVRLGSTSAAAQEATQALVRLAHAITRLDTTAAALAKEQLDQEVAYLAKTAPQAITRVQAVVGSRIAVANHVLA